MLALELCAIVIRRGFRRLSLQLFKALLSGVLKDEQPEMIRSCAVCGDRRSSQLAQKTLTRHRFMFNKRARSAKHSWTAQFSA